MNPLAIELNEKIESVSPPSFSLLSELGKELFLKAHKYNAAIGIATEKGIPMHLTLTAARDLDT